LFQKLKDLVRSAAHRRGYRVSRIRPYAEELATLYVDADPWVLTIAERLEDFHMTSPERMIALCKAVEHLVKTGVQGDIVECGVWRGGSMMAVASTLLHLGRTDRDLHLFDTFEGMTAPAAVDRDYKGAAAEGLLEEAKGDRTQQIWAYAGLDAVKSNMRSTGYPEARIHYVQGRVEDTLPAQAPQAIALLRLDTDWYESTIHELRTLWDRLAVGGILIVDDYGQWQGARKAVDEFFANLDSPPFLMRIDYTGRLAVKIR